VSHPGLLGNAPASAIPPRHSSPADGGGSGATGRVVRPTAIPESMTTPCFPARSNSYPFGYSFVPVWLPVYAPKVYGGIQCCRVLQSGPDPTK